MLKGKRGKHMLCREWRNRVIYLTTSIVIACSVAKVYITERIYAFLAITAFTQACYLATYQVCMKVSYFWCLFLMESAILYDNSFYCLCYSLGLNNGPAIFSGLSSGTAVHIFPKAQVASNKNAHKLLHHFCAQFFMLIRMVWSILFRVLALKTLKWKFLIGC